MSSSAAPSPRKRILTDPIDVRRRLRDLGLEEDDLRSVVNRGLAARLSCTENHPLQSAGYYAWSEAVCAMREIHVPRNWERSDESNLPFTVNADRSVAIAIATGDENTGCPDKEPCTKSSKGPKTRSIVDANVGQILMFPDLVLKPEHLAQINARMTWLLLMHFDPIAREVRSELSRPVSMDQDQRVDGWDERIMLRSIPLDGDLVRLSPTGNTPPQSPEIVLEIKRRA